MSRGSLSEGLPGRYSAPLPSAVASRGGSASFERPSNLVRNSRAPSWRHTATSSDGPVERDELIGQETTAVVRRAALLA
jgi:hypothetical protein